MKWHSDNLYTYTINLVPLRGLRNLLAFLYGTSNIVSGIQNEVLP